MSKQFNTRIQHKIDTYEHWDLAKNFRPLDGEIIIFTPDPKDPEDTRPVKLKIGSENKLLSELNFVVGDISAESFSQSDWNQTDIYSPDYIKNKPEIGIDIEENSSKLATSGAVFEAIKKIASTGGIAYEAGKLTKIENNKISSTLGEKIGEKQSPGTFLYSIDGEEFFYQKNSDGSEAWFDMDMGNDNALASDLLKDRLVNNISAKNTTFNLKIKNSLLEELTFQGVNLGSDDSLGFQLSFYFFNLDCSKLNSSNNIILSELPKINSNFPAFEMVVIGFENYSIPILITPEVPTGNKIEVYIQETLFNFFNKENNSMSFNPNFGLYQTTFLSENIPSVDANKYYNGTALAFSNNSTENPEEALESSFTLIFNNANFTLFDASSFGYSEQVWVSFINSSQTIEDFFTNGLIKDQENLPFLCITYDEILNAYMIMSDTIIATALMVETVYEDVYETLPNNSILTDKYFKFDNGKLNLLLGSIYSEPTIVSLGNITKGIHFENYVEMEDPVFTEFKYGAEDVKLFPFNIQGDYTLNGVINNLQPITGFGFEYSNETINGKFNILILNSTLTFKKEFQTYSVEDLFLYFQDNMTKNNPDLPLIMIYQIENNDGNFSTTLATSEEFDSLSLSANIIKQTCLKLPENAIETGDYLKYDNGNLKFTPGETKEGKKRKVFLSSILENGVSLDQPPYYLWDWTIDEVLDDIIDVQTVSSSNQIINTFKEVKLENNLIIDQMIATNTGVEIDSIKNGRYAAINTNENLDEILNNFLMTQKDTGPYFVIGIYGYNNKQYLIIISSENFNGSNYGVNVLGNCKISYIEKLPSSYINLHIGDGLITNNGVLHNSYGKIIAYEKSTSYSSISDLSLNTIYIRDEKEYYVTNSQQLISLLNNFLSKNICIDLIGDSQKISLVGKIDENESIHLLQDSFIINNEIQEISLIWDNNSGILISSYPFTNLQVKCYEISNIEYSKLPKEALEYDNIPTNNSLHLMTSGSIYNAFQSLKNEINNNTASIYTSLETTKNELSDDLTDMNQALIDSMNTTKQELSTSLQTLQKELQEDISAIDEKITNEIEFINISIEFDENENPISASLIEDNFTSINTHLQNRKMPILIFNSLAKICTMLFHSRQMINNIETLVFKGDFLIDEGTSYPVFLFVSIDDTISIFVNNIENEDFSSQISSIEQQHNIDVEELNGKITTLEEKHDNNIEELNGKITTLEEKHDTDIEELNGKITTLEEKHDNNFNTLEEMISSLEDITDNLLNTEEILNTHNKDIQDIKDTYDEKMEILENIAAGKCKTYVFDTKAVLDSAIEDYKDDNLLEGNPLYGVTLKTGDIFLIKAIDIPDYWWDDNSKDIYPLEARKFSLDDYVTKEEFNNGIPTDYITQNEFNAHKTEANNTYAKQSDIPTDYVTQNEFNTHKTEANNTYAKKGDIPTDYITQNEFNTHKTEANNTYAKKGDIPTSLPANGGNADTINGKGIRIVSEDDGGLEGYITFVVG